MIKGLFQKYIFLVLVLTIFSCVPKKDIVYFQFENDNKSEVIKEYVTVFKPGDILEILITSVDPLVVKHFNLTSTGSESNTMPYIIDNDGNIEFPVFGKIRLAGLTKKEAVEVFKTKLSKTVKNPGVHIKILNFNITILGDVKTPGNYTIPNERVNIIEAIGLAGDLNISGKRDNITVKRLEGSVYKYYQLDIRSKKINESPAYNLQQNDIIYVEPNRAKSQSASSNQNTGLYFSVASLLITLITLISR